MRATSNFTYCYVVQGDVSSLHATVVGAWHDVPGIPSSGLHVSQSIPKI